MVTNTPPCHDPAAVDNYPTLGWFAHWNRDARLVLAAANAHDAAYHSAFYPDAEARAIQELTQRFADIDLTAHEAEMLIGCFAKIFWLPEDQAMQVAREIADSEVGAW